MDCFLLSVAFFFFSFSNGVERNANRDEKLLSKKHFVSFFLQSLLFNRILFNSLARRGEVIWNFSCREVTKKKKKSWNFSFDVTLPLFVFHWPSFIFYVKKTKVYTLYLSTKQYNRLRAFSHYSIFVIRFVEVNVDRLLHIDRRYYNIFSVDCTHDQLYASQKYILKKWSIFRTTRTGIGEKESRRKS